MVKASPARAPEARWRALAPRAQQATPGRTYGRFALRVGWVFMAVLWAALASSVSLAAQPPLDVRQLVEIARHDNKDLQAARLAIDLARARLLQAGLRANPRLELSAQSDFLFRNEGEFSSSVGLSQEFPVAGRIARQKDVARVDIALAELEVAEAERRIAAELIGKVYRLVLVSQQVSTLDGTIAVEETLAQTARRRFRAAEVSEMDVNTVRLDIQRLALERSLLQGEAQGLSAGINILLGRPPTEPLRVDSSVPLALPIPPLAALERTALAQRADLRGAMLGLDRAAAERALARAQKWQDWTVGVEFAQDRQVVAGAPSQGTDRAIGVSVSIPLPLHDKSQGLLAEAEANRARSEARVEALHLEIRGELAAAHAEATRLAGSLAQYRGDVLPIAQRNVRLAQLGYSMGLTSVFEVVQAQRQLSETRRAYLDLQDQYLKAVVRLHTAAGDDLPVTTTSTTFPGDR